MTARSVFAVAALSLVPFGLIIALGAHPLTAVPVALATDLLFWPLDGGQTLVDPQARLYSGISGGLCAGLGLMLWMLARDTAIDSRHLARLTVAPVLTWFVIDSVGSTVAGAPLNALVNALFVALLFVPLFLATRAPTRD